MSIATNAGQSDTAAMRKALNRVHVEHYFDHCFSSKDIGFEKPDKRFFNEICRQLSFLPHHCLMIGNDYKKDIEGASAAGLSTVFFNEKLIPGNYHQASYTLNRLIEIKDIL